MFDANSQSDCTKRCWLIALAAGVVLALLLLLFGSGLLLALLIGIFVFAGTGVFLIKTRCSGKDTEDAPTAAEAGPEPAPAAKQPAPSAAEAKPEPVRAAERPAPSAAEAKPEPAADQPAPAAAPEPAVQSAPAVQPAAEPRVKPSAALAGQAELAARKGSWKYQGGAAAPAPAAAPAQLEAARGGKPDNLKLIKGVGPKLEQLLNSMGFYHFDQIAGWSAAEAAWVDENLEGFKGRVSRDNWVEQAATLAAGGETEFSRRKQ